MKRLLFFGGLFSFYEYLTRFFTDFVPKTNNNIFRITTINFKIYQSKE